LYHVITRGNRRQGVFQDEKDFEQFLTYLSNCKNRFPFRLYAYALMQNHLHFLIEVGEIPLSRIMQSLLFGYAHYFNRRYREVGHLFQGRYKAILCDKDAYLLELVRYIHLNPVRARIAKRPEDYTWTGHLSYLGKGRKGLIDEGFILDQFGGSRSMASRKYRQFVWEGISEGHEEKYYRVKDQLYLGEDGFINQIKMEKKDSGDWVYDIPLEAISQGVSRETGISEDKLYSVTRDREGASGRGIVAYLARVISDYTVREIGDHFRRSPAAIGEAIMKVEDHLHRDRSFAKALERMREKLIEGRKRKYRITVA
jgi:REP element-mobilizing transposase RayT